MIPRAMSKLVANRGHPLNVGRQNWWLALPDMVEGNHVWRDMMGENHMWRVVGTQGTLQWHFNGALRQNAMFSGGSNVCYLGNQQTAFYYPPAFTFMAWVKQNGTPFGTTICGERVSGGATGCRFFVLSQKLHLEITTTSIRQDLAGATTNPGSTWFHAACTYDGTTMTVYVNGVSDGTATPAGTFLPPSTKRFWIGVTTDTSDRMNGWLNDVGVWRRVLKVGEIKQYIAATRRNYEGLLIRQPLVWRGSPVPLPGGGQVPVTTPIKYYDRVWDTATTTGLGTFTLAGVAPTGFRTFNAALTTADFIYYCIAHQTDGTWEVGIGQWTSPATLLRNNFLSSSTGAPITFASGTKDVTVVKAAQAGLGLATPGDIKATASIVLPVGWLLCDGSAVSRNTYDQLFSAIVRTGTATLTVAAPCVVTWAAHGLSDGDPVKFTTTGALPTGLTAGTTYYVKAIDATTFNLAATPGGAAITTTGAQSGVHTAICAPYGDGNGTTTFNLPDLRGRTALGSGAGTALTQRALGASGGEESHALTIPELPAHTHTVNGYMNASIPAGSFVLGGSPGNTTYSSGSTGSGTAHNVMHPYVVCRHVIKT